MPAAAEPVLPAVAVAAVLALEPVRRAGTAVATAAAAGLAHGGVALSVRALHVRSDGWGSVAGLAAGAGGGTGAHRRRGRAARGGHRAR